MPASLLSAKIRGVRSFSPSEDRAQKIEFTPVTLIVGSNGSGKTTIIESLKFIISGDEPPLSDSRRNFINSTSRDTKKGNKGSSSSSTASIELDFYNSKGDLCHAKREIQAPVRTGPPSVSSAYKIGGKSWVNVNRQEEWTRTIPRLFNLPNQAILNYIILCHQDDNLWCMGDSSSVKQIFDKIFGCEQYKKEIKHIETEMRSCKSDIALAERELLYHKERVARREQVAAEVLSLKKEISTRKSQIKSLEITLNILSDSSGLHVKKPKLEETGQQAQEDDMSRDLVRVKELVENMSAQTSQIPDCPPLSTLNTLIEDALSILENLISGRAKVNIETISRHEELKLRDERSVLIGSTGQMERELDRLETELKSHSRTMSSYAETLGKIACNAIILRDLERLKTCFQQSITSFHDQMILKINQVLKLRWRSIYKGHDIDYIELVDEEITKGKDKKAFNYYIGMCKAGVKMKMREKSSTGQKALASIILRMTLAELFVRDLAFIALDEPTANLDAANASSLAEAIGIYVKKRIKRGLNLQWIIITHSEKFLAKLNAECTEYYKVTLDDQNSSTIIKTSCDNLCSLEEDVASS